MVDFSYDDFWYVDYCNNGISCDNMAHSEALYT